LTSAQEKFQALLRELFQFDCADLDFGIYRIMNYKRDVIEKFISTDLPELIGEELNRDALADQSQAAAELAEIADEIVRTLGKDALDADGNLVQFQETKIGKKYLSLQAKAAGGRGLEALETTIFNHLYTFFSRYYQDGDFISKRRYSKRQKYAIPYNGEEVYLYWANHDQYYIKTAEHFHDYTFTSQGVTVHFKLTDANVEQNNVKGDRRFFLPSVKELDWREKENELVIPFEYRPLTEKEQVTYGTKNQQDKIIAEACEAIPRELKKADKALAAIIAERRKDSDNQPVTFLEHHLRQYTRKNTSDFFIHKDLKGFLSRELDFYLKNEVLNLDEMEAAGEGRSEGWFQVLRVIKAVGSRIIDFLDQIESFQKMLWEKRKFITETQYCISLDRVPEELYQEIAANDAQREEWVRLFAIDEVKGDMVSTPYSEPLTVEFLKANDKLVLDTALFPVEFKNRLLDSIDDIEAQTDGLLVHSENFQALDLLQQRYKEQINAVYIDPPYNTGEDGFIYKDAYRHSSWLALIVDRLYLSKEIQRGDSAIYASINEDELYNFKFALDGVYGRSQYLSTFTVKVRHENRILKGDKDFHEVFENVLAYRKSGDHLPVKRQEDNSSLDDYVWKVRVHEPQQILKMNGKRVEVFPPGNYTLERGEPSIDGLKRINIRGSLRQGNSSGRFYVANLEPLMDRFPNCLFRVPDMGNDRFGHRYFWLPASGRRNGDYFQGVPVDRQDIKKVPYANLWDFEKEFNQCADEGGTVFRNGKKPIAFLKHILLLAGVIEKKNSIVLDFFAGSGSTGHAVIDLNRNDGGHRKYILVEMGDYFDTVLKPRMKKVVYSADWKDGKPTSRNTGTSHCFKYIRLESYEDALNNIEFDETAGQQALEFDDYLLKYMLKWETRKSETLLNVEKLAKPFSYKLTVAQGDETIDKTVDIPETFNYLLGLQVSTRKVYDDDGRRYLVYHGRIDHRRIAVIWRETEGWEKKDLERDKRFVAEQKLAEGADEVFVNGDSFIAGAKALEPVFKARMFAPVEA